MLSELSKKVQTDKGSCHSYLDVYQELFEKKQETARHVLEIGIHRGDSIKLWKDFFTNATIYGLQSDERDDILPEVRNNEKIILYFSIDAYDIKFFTENILNNDVKFDIVIDDGSHRLTDMITCINLYSKVLADDGILIVEDVQEWEWISHLEKAVPDNLKQFIKVYDLRSNKGRYDDILFVINKNVGCV